ncbi:MAG: hypothetical protein ACRCX7_11165 [Cetobacterium sp.]|uniref:hypothetical protein n=1 Tax=Cetobacterium sp. TaxID=2071632 RepID=UPI003F352592
MQQQLTNIVDISNGFSTNIYGYIIFISIIFLACFMFLGWQLLNIFKSLLQKVLEDVLKKLDRIEQEVKELKEKVKN